MFDITGCWERTAGNFHLIGPIQVLAVEEISIKPIVWRLKIYSITYFQKTVYYFDVKSRLDYYLLVFLLYFLFSRYCKPNDIEKWQKEFIKSLLLLLQSQCQKNNIQIPFSYYLIWFHFIYLNQKKKKNIGIIDYTAIS